MINRSLDENRAASSTSLESTRQALARSGLGGTGFAQSLLAGETMQAEQSAAEVPTNIASQFISGAPGLVSPGIGALATAGGLTRNVSTTSTPSFWDMFNQTLAAGGMLGQGAGMATGAGII